MPHPPGDLGGVAELSQLPSTTFNDRHETNELTPTPPQRQQSLRHSTPKKGPDPTDRQSTPSSSQRSLRRTPRLRTSPSPEPRQVHLAAASAGFSPQFGHLAEQTGRGQPAHQQAEPEFALKPRSDAPSRPRYRPSQLLIEDPDEESSDPNQSRYRSQNASTSKLRDFKEHHSHPAVHISKHTHSAILFTLEEALRHPNPFSADFVEETASMADLSGSGVFPPTTNGGTSGLGRPTAAPAPTGSPGIKGPRMIMQERAAREARQRAEQEQLKLERARAEQEARLLENAQAREAERRNAGVVAGQGNSRQPNTYQQADSRSQGQPPVNSSQNQTQQTRPPQPQSQSQSRPIKVQDQEEYPKPGEKNKTTPPEQPKFQPQTEGNGTAQEPPPNTKPRNSFPHAFERWETLSAHWEGLTSFWIRKLEQNKSEINRDPLSQQLARQVTDLSAAGANLFHAVVELQRLRASSERKFQRWFFETRSELERAREVNAMLEQALEKERQNRSEAIRNAVESDQGNSKVQKQLAEMRKELAISKEEARRAWEELGRREQEERDKISSLGAGQPTLVGGIQVVPMQQRYAQEYQRSEHSQQAPSSAQPPTTQAGYTQSRRAAASDGGYSEGEYVTDLQGNPLLDVHGNRIPFAAPPSTYNGSEMGVEDYDTPITTNPPTGGQPTPSTSGSTNPPKTQDYSGQGYGSPAWEDGSRHQHQTRLSDVMEEDDEQRSRTSAASQQGGRV